MSYEDALRAKQYNMSGTFQENIMHAIMLRVKNLTTILRCVNEMECLMKMY